MNWLVVAIRWSSFVSGVDSRRLLSCLGSAGKFKYTIVLPSSDQTAGPTPPTAIRSFRFCPPSQFTSHHLFPPRAKSPSHNSFPRRYSTPARRGRGRGSEIGSVDSTSVWAPPERSVI